jgi:hypothetical protein
VPALWLCHRLTLRISAPDDERQGVRQRHRLGACSNGTCPTISSGGGETLLVVTAARDLALRRAMLPERRTGATLGDIMTTDPAR